jgi:hypothetical protein
LNPRTNHYANGNNHYDQKSAIHGALIRAIPCTLNKEA